MSDFAKSVAATAASVRTQNGTSLAREFSLQTAITSPKLYHQFAFAFKQGSSTKIPDSSIATSYSCRNLTLEAILVHDYVNGIFCASTL